MASRLAYGPKVRLTTWPVCVPFLVLQSFKERHGREPVQRLAVSFLAAPSFSVGGRGILARQQRRPVIHRKQAMHVTGRLRRFVLVSIALILGTSALAENEPFRIAGAKMEPVFEGGSPAGLRLSHIVPGECIASLGLLNGDVLVEFNRQPVDSITTYTRFLEALGEKFPFSLEVRRQDGETRSLEAVGCGTDTPGRGTVCVAPHPSEDSQFPDHYLMIDRPILFRARFDELEWITLSASESVQVTLPLGRTHVVQLEVGGQRHSSFWFSFRERGSTQLCLRMSAYHDTWHLRPVSAPYPCGCEPGTSHLRGRRGGAEGVFGAQSNRRLARLGCSLTTPGPSA